MGVLSEMNVYVCVYECTYYVCFAQCVVRSTEGTLLHYCHDVSMSTEV